MRLTRSSVFSLYALAHLELRPKEGKRLAAMKRKSGLLTSVDTVRAINLIAAVSARPDKRAAAIPAMAEGLGRPRRTCAG